MLGNNRRLHERDRSSIRSISQGQDRHEENKNNIMIAVASTPNHQNLNNVITVREESPIIKTRNGLNKHPSAGALPHDTIETVYSRNAYNDRPHPDTTNMVNTDEKSIFELEQKKSKTGKVGEILQKPYTNEGLNTKPKNDEIENLYLLSDRPTTFGDKAANSSIYGNLESFRDSKLS
jgi:hypothetical protein